MGTTKIIVLQLREIIKTAVFALIGLILIIALVYLFMPKNNSMQDSAIYTPGTYSAQIILQNSPVSVEVTVSQNEILSIDLRNMAEIQEVFYPLIQPTMQNLANEIIKTQSLEIETNAENGVTTNLLLNAIREALNNAKIKTI